MEEMQQKAEAWKVLHYHYIHYITYKDKNKFTIYTNTKNNSHTHIHFHTTQQNKVCLRNSKGIKEQKICTNIV